MDQAIPRKNALSSFSPKSSELIDLQTFNSGCVFLMFEQGAISPSMYDILQNKIAFTKQIAAGGGDYNEKENIEECIIGLKDGELALLYRLSLQHGLCKVFELDHSDTLLLDDKGATLIMAGLPEDGKISLPIPKKNSSTTTTKGTNTMVLENER